MLVEPKNGTFSIQTREDGVYLSVEAPAGDASPIELGQVWDALSADKIENYNRAAVEEAVRSMTGAAIRIAEPPKPRPQAEISVLVSRDRMEAFLQIDLPEGA